MADPLYSDYLRDPAHWDAANPDYTAVNNILGHGATAQPVAMLGLINVSLRSPLAVAFVIEGDEDYIHIGHSPSLYPAEPGSVTPFDNHVVVLVGDAASSSVPVVLPDVAFGRTNAHRCFDLPTILGPDGHGSGPPPVYHLPLAATADANASDLQVRRVLTFPSSIAALAVASNSEGRMSYPAFHTTFLQAQLLDPDDDIRTGAEHARDWFCSSSTVAAGGASCRTAIAPITTAAPVTQGLLTRWANRTKNRILAAMGVGGPVLSTAAFSAGVNQLQNTMEATADARLQFERDRRNQSFTDKHGTAQAQRLYYLCGVTDDAGLPEVHNLLARAPKGRDHGILRSLLSDRARASAVPLTTANAPKPTNKLTDEVFRSFDIAGTGLEFARGLSPFSIVCEGHPESAQVASAVKQAELAEGGTALSFADASKLTSTDVRYPTTPQIAAEKLYAWSVMVDVFHGNTQPIAIAIRNFVINVGPALHRVAEQCGPTPAIGMDMVNRVLYEAQQDYFAWVHRRVIDGTAAPPDFSHISDCVHTYRVNRLSGVPASWYTLLPAESRRATLADHRDIRQPSGSVSVFNSNADQRLLRRFEESPHTKVSDMISGQEAQIPKHAGQDVCLVWALKGQCSTNCSRKAQHVRYSRDTVANIHRFMDACGVTNSQP